MLSILSAARLAGFVVVAGLVAGCSSTPETVAGVSDPLESVNRSIHEYNKVTDRTFVRPASKAYAAVVPGPARRGVSNFASNLNEPIRFINHTLQGDVQSAGATFARFGINTVFGLGGLLDAATDMGVAKRDTDFGETLAVAGVGPGPYLELPFFGPSTVRDAVGLGVDFLIDPEPNVTDIKADSDVEKAIILADGLDVLQFRHEFRGVIDQLLYESSDSYAASRIAYLQARAAKLGGDTLDDVELEDPFDF